MADHDTHHPSWTITPNPQNHPSNDDIPPPPSPPPSHKNFWTTQFAHLTASPFPPLPSPRYLPRPSLSVEHNIEGLGWDSSAFKPSVFIRLAWAILQSRYTNNPDVLFGAAAGINGTAFPNRVRLVGWETVSGVLGLLQRQGEMMVAAAAANGAGGRGAVGGMGRESSVAAWEFGTLLVLTSSSSSSSSSSASAQKPEAVPRDRRRSSLIELYALTIECTVSLSGLRVRFVHDPAVVDGQQVERMVAQLGFILRQILMQPQSRLAEISVASEEDVSDIWSWNGSVPRKVEGSVVDLLLRKRVATRAEALAVDAWDGCLTYVQLEDFSTRLALHLAALGVGSGAIVPLCVEKSKWMSVAILAVMKAGAASMCLNANHPVDYLRGTVARSRPSALICSTNTQSLAAQLTDRPVVALSESFFANLTIVTPVSALPAVQPTDRLCVIPTTGQSLAVLTHSNFATALAHQTKLFDISSNSRIYDLDSYNCDLTWLNQLLAFTNGACLCVPSDEARKCDIADSLSQFRASVLITTATSAQNIDLSQAIDLETLVVSGEVTPKLELPPHVRLISVYGVPECTILATYATERQVLNHDRCIGRGLAANMWIVSTSGTGELCGVGEIGELWLESPLVGDGYLNDAQKWKASFVDCPGFLEKGAPDVVGRRGLLYRMGDLVRYLPDGTVAFVGHRDAHIQKIRGLRVDMTEVETHMRQILGDEIVDVVVEVITAQGQPAPVLAGFIIPAGDTDHSSVLEETVAQLAEALTPALKRALPSYMVPIVFLPLRAVPRTTSGEVNRQRLREKAERKSRVPENRNSTHAIRPTQAMTVLEVQLQQLWIQVLGAKDRTSITANSNWIELGGDESSARRLVSAAQNWGLAITVADVLARPRLADMAECVKHFHRASVVAPEGFDQPWSDMRRGTFPAGFVSETSAWGPARPTPNGNIDRRRSSLLVNGREEVPAAPMALMPVTATQKRVLRGSVDHSPAGIEYYAFDLPPTLDQAHVIDACRQLVQHFDMLRTIFVQVEDAVYQTTLPTVEVPMEVQHIASSVDESCKAVIRQDSALPIVLGRTLLRIYVLHKPAEHLRIILRTTQAYTDASAISTLASALSHVLNHNDLAPTPSLLDYHLHHTRSQTSSHQAYWRNLILGSSMTFIPKSLPHPPTSNKSPPSSTDFEMLSVYTSLRFPSIPPHSSSTIFTAACALVLAHLTTNANTHLTKTKTKTTTFPIKEVLFARHVPTSSINDSNSNSNNNKANTNIYTPYPPPLPVSHPSTPTIPFLGPCSNFIPVRVRLTPRNSLLGQVAEQEIAGEKFAGVDFESVANDACWRVLGRRGESSGKGGSRGNGNGNGNGNGRSNGSSNGKAQGEIVVDFGLVVSFSPLKSPGEGEGSMSTLGAGANPSSSSSSSSSSSFGGRGSGSGSSTPVRTSFLGRREGEVLRSDAVYISATVLRDGKVGVEVRAKSSVLSPERLEGVVVLLKEALGELEREGRGKRGFGVGVGVGGDDGDGDGDD